MNFNFNVNIRTAGKLAAALAALAVAGLAVDQTSSKPSSRDEATKIIADARKIVNPGGIEQLEKVRIGGIEQWVSIRGTDKRNPVLLLIHGGPGYVSMPMSWWFARGWEDYFTVVQWDQRGAGKTYLLNDGTFHFLAKSEIAKMDSASQSLMPSDYGFRLDSRELNDLVSYLMSVYGTTEAAKPKRSDEWDQ